MDMRSIRYFVAAYEEGSVSAAARRCFVAQPSISTAIAQMEERLGITLFLRHRKGVTPTPEAQRFYRSAVGLVGEFDAMQDLFREREAPPPLALAIMPSIDSKRMGEFLRKIIRDPEGLSLRLVDLGDQAEARIISDWLKEREEDFFPLWEEQYVLATAVGHRLAMRRSARLEELHGARFVERCHCERHDEVKSYLERSGIRPDTVARAKNEEWAASLVAAGLGVAILPETSVAGREDLAAIPIEDLDLARRIGIACDPSRPPSAGLQHVLDLL